MPSQRQMSAPLHPAFAICGRNVRHHRHHQGISLRKLATLAETSVITLDLIENGRIDPDFDLCLRIIIALQIFPKDFFAGVRELSTSPSVSGFEENTIEEIEDGRVRPTLGMVIALVRALNVSPEELCAGIIGEVEEE